MKEGREIITVGIAGYYDSFTGTFISFITENVNTISKTLTTKDLKAKDKFQCLSFRYFIGEEKRSHWDDIVTKLDVLAVYPGSNSTNPLWATSYRTDRWVYVQFPLNQSQEKFRVRI